MRALPTAHSGHGNWRLGGIAAVGLLLGCSAASTDERANACSDPLGCGAGAPTSSGGAGASTSTSGGGTGTGGDTSGGGTGTGGDTSSGGSGQTACTDVRPTGTEWDEATCPMWASDTSECGEAWMIDNNYCNESCGRCSSGGSDGSGGTGTGDAGPAPSTCTEPNSQQCSTYKVGVHCDLTYEIWTDSASACMTNTADGFLAEWTTENGNYLARKGVRPGSTSPVVTYSANYQPNGNSYLGIYGWTQDPLIEYYIIDSWGSWRPPGTEVIGTVDVDGGTYEIYRSLRENKPSIEGDTTFWQYWSVRTQKRTSGTITVAPHFAAWEEFGLTMGSFYEVSLVVEGYNSSGNADVAVSFQ